MACLVVIAVIAYHILDIIPKSSNEYSFDPSPLVVFVAVLSVPSTALLAMIYRKINYYNWKTALKSALLANMALWAMFVWWIMFSIMASISLFGKSPEDSAGTLIFAVVDLAVLACLVTLMTAIGSCFFTKK